MIIQKTLSNNVSLCNSDVSFSLQEYKMEWHICGLLAFITTFITAAVNQNQCIYDPLLNVVQKPVCRMLLGLGKPSTKIYSAGKQRMQLSII